MIGHETIWCDYIGHEGVSRSKKMGVKTPKDPRRGSCRLWKSEKDVPKGDGFNRDELLSIPEEAVEIRRLAAFMARRNQYMQAIRDVKNSEWYNKGFRRSGK